MSHLDYFHPLLALGGEWMNPFFILSKVNFCQGNSALRIGVATAGCKEPHSNEKSRFPQRGSFHVWIPPRRPPLSSTKLALSSLLESQHQVKAQPEEDSPRQQDAEIYPNVVFVHREAAEDLISSNRHIRLATYSVHLSVELIVHHAAKRVRHVGQVVHPYPPAGDILRKDKKS